MKSTKNFKLKTSIFSGVVIALIISFFSISNAKIDEDVKHEDGLYCKSFDSSGRKHVCWICSCDKNRQAAQAL